MIQMQKVTAGAAEMIWDPTSRLAVLRFEHRTHATGAAAAVLVAALEGWLGAEKQPFALLGDGANLAGVDAAYRAAWGAFFRQHRDHSFVAFYNMSPLIRVAAEMFRLGTGVQLAAFGEERKARDWLRGRGIAA